MTIMTAAMPKKVDKVGKGGGVASPSLSARGRAFRRMMLNQAMTVSEGLPMDHRQMLDDRSDRQRREEGQTDDDQDDADQQSDE